jgi:hypothetical protein
MMSAMTRNQQKLLISCLLGLGALIALVSTSCDYGVTWDEAFPQFANALLQAEWFQGFGHIGNPFSDQNVSEYWDTTRRYPDIQRSDHPSLPKTIMALSYLATRGFLGTIRSLRLPNNLYFAVLIGVLCYWMSKRSSLVEGVGASLALIAMPRVFGHAHVAGLDLPILVLWVLSALAYFEAVERPTWKRHIICGLVYGLAACSKLHAFFFPIGFLLWAIGDYAASRGRQPSNAEQSPGRSFWRPHFRNLICMAAFAVGLYLATQPFLWHHTWDRLTERFSHYAGKATGAPISLYYLGKTYRGSTPWHYPLIMTAVTVPIPILVLAIIGVAGSLRAGAARFEKLCLVSWLASIGLVLLPLAQAYDGVRLFLASFAFLAIFAGKGLGRLLLSLRSRPTIDRLPSRWRPYLGAGLLVVFLIMPFWTLARLYPFHLEYYSALLGGIRGAQRMGMESTYWCDALTPEFLETLNRTLPDGANLRPLCMSYQVLEFYREEGLLNPSLSIDAPGIKDFHLLQCRQGMMGDPNERVLITGWDFYRGRYGPRLKTVSKDGVPFFVLYGPLPGVR